MSLQNYNNLVHFWVDSTQKLVVWIACKTTWVVSIHLNLQCIRKHHFKEANILQLLTSDPKNLEFINCPWNIIRVESIGRKFLFTKHQRRLKMKQLKAAWDNRNKLLERCTDHVLNKQYITYMHTCIHIFWVIKFALILISRWFYMNNMAQIICFTN